LQQAEDILEVACAHDATGDYMIVVDRRGAVRMLNGEGWSLAALATEFGGAAVFRVERRRGTVRVEGWDGARRCL